MSRVARKLTFPLKIRPRGKALNIICNAPVPIFRQRGGQSKRCTIWSVFPGNPLWGKCFPLH